MKFYGIQKTTLLDYPHEVAATIFTFGCNFRCPYCHNPELIIKNEIIEPIEWKEIFDFLKKRKNVLGGVCITGGEPLIHEELIDVVNDIHSIGLKVKIDTNGSEPERIKKINADYIAMDIKTSFDKYGMIGYIGDLNIIENIKESIRWIIESNIQHEFRTTVVPYIVEKSDIKKITEYIKGCRIYYLSQYRINKMLDNSWEEVKPYPKYLLEEMKKIVEDTGIVCELRGVL